MGCAFCINIHTSCALTFYKSTDGKKTFNFISQLWISSVSNGGILLSTPAAKFLVTDASSGALLQVDNFITTILLCPNASKEHPGNRSAVLCYSLGLSTPSFTFVYNFRRITRYRGFGWYNQVIRGKNKTKLGKRTKHETHLYGAYMRHTVNMKHRKLKGRGRETGTPCKS